MKVCLFGCFLIEIFILQSAELSPRKVRAAGAASVAGAITGAFGTAVDATGKIIGKLFGSIVYHHENMSI